MLEYLAVQADGCRAVRATGVQSEMELSSSTRSVITWGCSTRRVIRTISCTARRSFTRAATHPKHKPTSPQTRRRRSKALMVNKTVRDASPRAGGRVVRAGAAGVLPVGRWPPSARRSRLARRAGDDLIFARQRRAVAGEPGRRAGWVGERPRERLTCRCGLESRLISSGHVSSSSCHCAPKPTAATSARGMTAAPRYCGRDLWTGAGPSPRPSLIRCRRP